MDGNGEPPPVTIVARAVVELERMSAVVADLAVRVVAIESCLGAIAEAIAALSGERPEEGPPRPVSEPVS